MKPTRMIWGFLFWGFALSVLNFSLAWAQTEYPSKPITLLVGYPPGGVTDLLARSLAITVEKSLGQPVIISNKPGASASLSLALLAQAKPDGYTIGMVPSTATLFLPLVQKVSYDPLEDFTYVIGCANYAMALVVRADAPWNHFKEFTDYALKNPRKVKYGQGGPHQPATFVMEAIGKQLGIQWESVPFVGEPDQIAALLGGHITAATSSSSYPPQVRAGKLRILAMMSGKRWPEFPEAPTLKDLGFNHVVEGMIGIAGPKGLPEPIRMKLEEAFTQSMKAQPFLELIKKIALFEDYRTGKELTKFVAETFHYHKELVRKSELKEEMKK